MTKIKGLPLSFLLFLVFFFPSISFAKKMTKADLQRAVGKLEAKFKEKSELLKGYQAKVKKVRSYIKRAKKLKKKFRKAKNAKEVIAILKEFSALLTEVGLGNTKALQEANKLLAKAEKYEKNASKKINKELSKAAAKLYRSQFRALANKLKKVVKDTKGLEKKIKRELRKRFDDFKKKLMAKIKTRISKKLKKWENKVKKRIEKFSKKKIEEALKRVKARAKEKVLSYLKDTNGYAKLESAINGAKTKLKVFDKLGKSALGGVVVAVTLHFAEAVKNCVKTTKLGSKRECLSKGVAAAYLLSLVDAVRYLTMAYVDVQVIEPVCHLAAGAVSSVVVAGSLGYGATVAPLVYPLVKSGCDLGLTTIVQALLKGAFKKQLEKLTKSALKSRIKPMADAMLRSFPEKYLK